MPESSDTHEVREVERWNQAAVWLIGGLATLLMLLVVGIVGWYVSTQTETHQSLRSELDSIHRLLADRGERITKLESRVEECEKRKP